VKGLLLERPDAAGLAAPDAAGLYRNGAIGNAPLLGPLVLKDGAAEVFAVDQSARTPPTVGDGQTRRVHITRTGAKPPPGVLKFVVWPW
jgi:hypothetical protein